MQRSHVYSMQFHKNHILHKIFNRNTIKISYMSSIKQVIDGHNKTILSKKTNQQSKKLNCRKPDECPMLGQSGQCLTEQIVYQATVSTNDGPNQTYVGLTANTFKTRFNNHKISFKNPRKKHCTELSKHVWKLKDDKVNFSIKWRILKQAKPYRNASNKCNLCLWGKYLIICNPTMASLNKRNELVSSCRHAKAFLLRNFVTQTLSIFILYLHILTQHFFSIHNITNITLYPEFHSHVLIGCLYFRLSTYILFVIMPQPLRHFI